MVFVSYRIKYQMTNTLKPNSLECIVIYESQCIDSGISNIGHFAAQQWNNQFVQRDWRWWNCIWFIATICIQRIRRWATQNWKNRIFSWDAKWIGFEWVVNRVVNVVQKHTKYAGGEVLVFIVLVMYWVSNVVTVVEYFAHLSIDFVSILCSSLTSLYWFCNKVWMIWMKNLFHLKWCSHKVFGVCVMPNVY